MNLFKRIKNLWELSKWEPSSSEKEQLMEVGDKLAPLFQKKAQIIKYEKQTPVEKIVNS